jgi:pimeloyl-ACP methyl ester carboxylesterase
MRPAALVGCAITLFVLAAFAPVVAQEISGVEHWVEQAGLRLYVWEKYVGNPTGKPVVVLAHGSTSAGRESFDLQVPEKPSYSLMDVLAREGFDVFAPDIRGFGRSTRPDGHLTTQEASEDLNAVVDALLKLRGSQQVDLLGWSWGTQYSGMFIMAHPKAESALALYRRPAHRRGAGRGRLSRDHPAYAGAPHPSGRASVAARASGAAPLDAPRGGAGLTP